MKVIHHPVLWPLHKVMRRTTILDTGLVRKNRHIDNPFPVQKEILTIQSHPHKEMTVNNVIEGVKTLRRNSVRCEPPGHNTRELKTVPGHPHVRFRKPKVTKGMET
jgi:hypothetical protein